MMWCTIWAPYDFTLYNLLSTRPGAPCVWLSLMCIEGPKDLGFVCDCRWLYKSCIGHAWSKPYMPWCAIVVDCISYRRTCPPQGDTMCVIVVDVYRCPVFSESLLRSGVSSGRWMDTTVDHAVQVYVILFAITICNTCVYIYICICIYYIYTHLSLSIYIYIYIHMYMYVCMYIYIYI